MRPRGNSMAVRIESGDLVKLRPAKPEDLHIFADEAVSTRFFGGGFVAHRCGLDQAVEAL